MTSTDRSRDSLYARVSGDQQVEDDTIASQLDLLERRILQDGRAVTPELRFIDDGYRGETLLRPGLERSRDTAAAGAIDRLYVENPDRLARNYAYQMVLVDELRHHGVEIIFLNGDLGQGPEGRSLLQVQGIIAEYERTKIRERCRRGRLFAARSGRVSAPGDAPYGYRYVTKQEGGGEARYVVSFAEARTVKEMFTWCGVEGCSLSRIRRRLKGRGIVTRTGKTTWDRSTVLGMLRNPAYMGEAQFNKIHCVPARPRLRPRRGAPEYPRRPTAKQPTPPEDRIPIAVPAIVEPGLFQAVQERLAAHRRHPGRAAVEPRYLLAGLVVCPACGYAYRGRAQGTPQHSYYRCSGSEASRMPGGVRICSNPAIRVDRLDEAVWSDVRGLLLEPERLVQEFERRLSRANDPREAARSSRGLDKLIGQAKRRIARLVEMYADGYIENDRFQRDMDVSRGRLAELESEREGLKDEESQRAELRLVIDRIEEFAAQMRAGLDTSDARTRRRIICALVKEIQIHAEEIRIVYRVDPRPFAQTAPAAGNMPVCWGHSATPLGSDGLYAEGVEHQSPRSPKAHPGSRGHRPTHPGSFLVHPLINPLLQRSCFPSRSADGLYHESPESPQERSLENRLQQLPPSDDR
jgi:site-specific DNA recombinase